MFDGRHLTCLTDYLYLESPTLINHFWYLWKLSIEQIHFTLGVIWRFHIFDCMNIQCHRTLRDIVCIPWPQVHSTYMELLKSHFIWCFWHWYWGLSFPCSPLISHNTIYVKSWTSMKIPFPVHLHTCTPNIVLCNKWKGKDMFVAYSNWATVKL